MKKTQTKKREPNKNLSTGEPNTQATARLNSKAENIPKS